MISKLIITLLINVNQNINEASGCGNKSLKLHCHATPWMNYLAPSEGNMLDLLLQIRDFKLTVYVYDFAMGKQYSKLLWW